MQQKYMDESILFCVTANGVEAIFKGDALTQFHSDGIHGLANYSTLRINLTSTPGIELSITSIDIIVYHGLPQYSRGSPVLSHH